MYRHNTTVTGLVAASILQEIQIVWSART